ncbi:MAG TPA: hypothetical protein VFW63_05395 [Acidimicrobiales bacterium]|nr:hypothetical protein [Acidimicrobiales bacterium]
MPSPSVDPRLVALARCVDALREELDRLDDHVDRLGPGTSERFTRRMASLRRQVDELDADVDAEAAGLVGPALPGRATPVPGDGPGRSRPGARRRGRGEGRR